MTNIRDQCSWVHKDDPEAATDKAVDLMRMAVARARHLKALETGTLPVTQSALVIGGGLAGMTAALGLPTRASRCTWSRRKPSWAASCAHIRTTLEGADVAGVPARPGGQGRRPDPNITRAPERDRRDLDRPRRQLQERHRRRPAKKSGAHGVIIIATGGQERDDRALPARQEPARRHPERTRSSAGRGRSARRVAGQGRPHRGDDPVRRESQRRARRTAAGCAAPRRSRTRSRSSERIPGANVVILGRDIRTYGFRELSYQKAREAGVMFVRHADGAEPDVSRRERRAPRAGARRLRRPRPRAAARPAGAEHRHRSRRRPTRSSPGMLRSALTADGFFLEAHPKLRPVDLANEGEFICGLVALAALHRRDHRPGQGRRGPRGHRTLEAVPGDPRPGVGVDPDELRRLRHLRQGLPLRRAA